MITSFADKETERLYKQESVRRFRSVERVALRKLTMLDAASELRDLSTPGNRLEALKGKLTGYHSIRINDQWRLQFNWIDGNAEEVAIVDYH